MIHVVLFAFILLLMFMVAMRGLRRRPRPALGYGSPSAPDDDQRVRPIGRQLAPGFGWNPLLAHRNIPCPCASGRKAKVCHGLSRTLPLKDVEGLKQWLKSAGVTK